MKDIQGLIATLRNGSFAKAPSSAVTIPIRPYERFINSLLVYIDYDSSDKNFDISVEYFFQKATPMFQRDHNQWTKEMQIKFVENLLAGCPTEIKLFRMNEVEDAQIIDGLQRLTAIMAFMNGGFSVYGFEYQDIKDYLSKFNTRFTVAVYTFDAWASVGRFYVDMNENITHSKEDIKKAKDWFLKEHNVVL